MNYRGQSWSHCKIPLPGGGAAPGAQRGPAVRGLGVTGCLCQHALSIQMGRPVVLDAIEHQQADVRHQAM